MQATKDVIAALSLDSLVTQDKSRVVDALKILYDENIPCLLSAMRQLLHDDDWSQDRQPYDWLQSIYSFPYCNY